eukprot:scaffold9072_cov62-Phaeocystis_antarctica.AAC.8
MLVIFLVHPGALVEQQLHHLRLVLANRHHQRSPAHRILLVDRRVMVEQQLHHLRVAEVGCPEQCGLAFRVFLVDQRALLEQQQPRALCAAIAARPDQRGPGQRHHLRLEEGPREPQRGCTRFVQTDVKRRTKRNRRAVVEQQLRHLRVARHASPQQRGMAVLVLLVNRRALVEH